MVARVLERTNRRVASGDLTFPVRMAGARQRVDTGFDAKYPKLFARRTDSVPKQRFSLVPSSSPTLAPIGMISVVTWARGLSRARRVAQPTFTLEDAVDASTGE